MKFVIQRVSSASVKVDNNVVGEIKNGFLVLVGISDDDTKEIADKLVRKMTGLRIFSDENDKINLSLSDTNGSILMVSQFTLYANCKKGYRPSFIEAGSPDYASELFDYIVDKSKEVIPHVETGIFGAKMEVSLVNEGPFTIILDSSEL